MLTRTVAGTADGDDDCTKPGRFICDTTTRDARRRPVNAVARVLREHPRGNLIVAEQIPDANDSIRAARQGIHPRVQRFSLVFHVYGDEAGPRRDFRQDLVGLGKRQLPGRERLQGVRWMVANCEAFLSLAASLEFSTM